MFIKGNPSYQQIVRYTLYYLHKIFKKEKKSSDDNDNFTMSRVSQIQLFLPSFKSLRVFITELQQKTSKNKNS